MGYVRVAELWARGPGSDCRPAVHTGPQGVCIGPSQRKKKKKNPTGKFSFSLFLSATMILLALNSHDEMRRVAERTWHAFLNTAGQPKRRE
jgi:hypothetical protein